MAVGLFAQGTIELEKLTLGGHVQNINKVFFGDIQVLCRVEPVVPEGFLLKTLNHAHPSFSFTMEIEKDGMLPFLGTQLLNCAPQIETKVRPTNTALLVHYQSHVDNWFKRTPSFIQCAGTQYGVLKGCPG